VNEVADLVPSVDALLQRLDDVDYLADPGLATALFCAVRLPQPLLLEGEAGVGKTEAGKALAAVLDTPLIRLQCYEGIDVSEALYEWNYTRQLLGIRLAESSGRPLDEHELATDPTASPARTTTTNPRDRDTFPPAVCQPRVAAPLLGQQS